MAHFAELDQNKKVISIVVINNDDCKDANGVESESVGIAFCNKLFGHANWVQTSYNHKIRRNYAIIGGFYDLNLDIFVGPQPSPNATYNAQTGEWENVIIQTAPTEKPIIANISQRPSEKATFDPITMKWVEK